VQPTRTAAVLTFEQGLFASDGTDISGPGQTVLLWLGDRLETHTQDLLVRVIGHTDSRPIRGPGRYVDNVELGMARAIAVINFLRRKAGVPYVLLSAATVGATKPLASNATERGRARNRTVVIEIAETVH
jgi:chemotaxis protein MotB